MLIAVPHPIHDPSEGLHLLGLGLAAFGLALGLIAGNPDWVKMGVSLMLLLPPLRLATTILEEARARRFRVAAMGTLVLVFLLLSRRIS